MAALASSMRQTVKSLLTTNGNSCTLTKVTKGAYSPALGKSSDTETTYNTFSAPYKSMSEAFALAGINTNLSGFGSTKVIIGWFGVSGFDKTWLYDSNNILSVETIKIQNMDVAYIIEIGERVKNGT